MRARRLLRTAGAASILIAVTGGFAPARADTAGTVERQLVADAFTQAFTLRVAADYGGASTLPFYFGSYADANLTNPPAAADGQASWYNLGIAEAAVFTPAPPDPKACTNEEQQRRVEQATKDVSDWVTLVAIRKLLKEQKIAVLPLPTLPCTERLPGFSQSRYPATRNQGQSANDDLLGSGLCRAGACVARDTLAPRTNGVVDGGRFTATATDTPSQNSDATVVGIHIPGVIDIGAARSVATAAIVGDRLVTEALWTAADVCIVPGVGSCALSIRSISQAARLERDAAGKVTKREHTTVIAGVSGAGQTREVTAAALGPGLQPIDLGGAHPGDPSLHIRGVSTTHGCGDPESENVADAGGLEIFGQGGGGPGVSLPVPIVGSTTGGGVLLGGACASGRFSALTIDLPGAPGPLSFDHPGTTIVLLPGAIPVAAPGPRGNLLSAPRVVEKESVRVVFRRAPAWRTAPYWGSVLLALLLACGLGYVFRRSRPVAPVAAAVDRFARQFIRG